jgi:hypothetical protein
MTQNWSGRRTIAAILGITAIGFILGIVALCYLWMFLRVLGFAPSFWAMTEALATAVAAAAVLGGAVLAYRELSEAGISRHMAVADRLFGELNSSESIRARRWIFLHLPDDPETGLKNLTDEGRDAIKHVLNSLDRVAFLTQAGWIPDDMVMPWMNPMIVKTWAKVGPYVEFESRRRNEPGYFIQVRRLAEQCTAWRKSHLPDAQITWIDGAL